MNGKVRIYELSKELDLDNKDILAIASRLDIAVKSHSSTIAESEADQIRAEARQSRSNGSGPNRPDRPRPPAPIKNGARPERKQQILEIRRHRVTPKADSAADVPGPVAPGPVAPGPGAPGPVAPSPGAPAAGIPSALFGHACGFWLHPRPRFAGRR